MKVSNIPKVAINFINGYKDATMYPKQRLPRVIQFPINDICNSKCQMCNIWQQKRDYEVTPEKIKEILNNDLFRKVKAVGINGGEPTLRKDIGEVTEAVVTSLPKLNSISLITNAIIEKKVIAAIKTMAEVCNQNNVHLGVMVSLDGVGDVHDRVRGRKGNFESAVKVLNFLKKSDGLVSDYRIGCTIIKENVFGVEDLLQWCIENEIYGRFRLGVPHQRLYSDNKKEPFDINYEEKFHIANFLDYLIKHYEKDETRRFFYKSLRDQIIYNQARKAGCDWKNRGVTLTSRGELAYCAVQSKILGDAKLEDSESLYWENSDHLKDIINNKCASCNHDYEGISNRKLFVKNYIKRVISKFPIKAQKIAKKLIVDVNHYYKAKNVLYSSRLTIRNHKELIPNQILICGWYGTETLGDKAILGGIINKIRSKSPNCIIHLASLEPYVSEMTSNQMKYLEISKILNVKDAKKRIADGNYEKIIMGGGPLMSSVGEITKILEMFSEADKVGSEKIIWGCGIGPISQNVNTDLIKKLLNISDKIIVRDKASKLLAVNKFGLDKSINVSLDPAFIWIKDNIKKDIKRDPKQIMLALRDWPINEYANDIDKNTAINIKAKFEKELLEFIDTLVQSDRDYKIIPFCMHKYATGGDDRFFYKRLLKNYPQILSRLDITHQTPQNDLEQFQRSAFVLAMRYHSTVFSIATETPYLSIDYTRGGKIRGLLNDLTLDNNLVTIDDFNGKKAVAMMEDIKDKNYNKNDQINKYLSTYDTLF